MTLESPKRSVHITPNLHLRGDQLIVLSFFDGIGTGILAIQELVGAPRLALSWEIDPAAARVVEHRLPFVKNRGDFLADSPAAIKHMVERHDPHQRCIVVYLAAPPCPDFSSINESAKSFNGKEGMKFDQYINFVHEVEQELKDWHSVHLCENVVMQTQAEIDYVSKGLGASPILIDASDLGIISRPRLWWSRHKWSSNDAHPLSGKPLRWGSAYKLPRLYMDCPLVEAGDLDLDGYNLSGTVSRHEKRLPCLTTPAPTAEGRPPPKKLRGKMSPEVRARWLEDNRRFAPWNYEEHAMLEKDGSLTIPWADHKDQLQGFEKGYTQVVGVSDHDRHRLLGNAWHLQVVKFLLMLLLQCSRGAAAQLGGVPPSVHETALQFVCRMSTHEPPDLGTVPPFAVSSPHRMADDLWDHWQLSRDCCHPVLASPSIEPGAFRALDHCLQRFSDVARLRQEVVAEVHNMVDEWQDITSQWIRGCASHVQEVYNQPGRPCVTQVPVFLQLLRDSGFPSMPDVEEDMQYGFALTGVQHAGPGWPVRQDERYSHPISDEQFRQLNRAYVKSKLKKAYVDPHWQTMLQEVLEERSRGRMVGPFSAPEDWPVRTVSVHGLPLLAAPSHHVYASVSFAVEQHDKVRRCEDFRRSWHNACMVAHDAPIHHGVDYYVQLCRWHFQQGKDPRVWVHDLDAAYRQLPVREVEKPT